ncbi:nucleotide exchange factor GrpE [Oscillatoria salina]|uniref:nucleotide exchange factor GrpE n=1 Tax=Oscillatoria salina TaxID=331517 RepID=UPI001CCE178E|nr:nucleotide exchange factor GrpE [Oscillatoria salina]MBZ8179553.1 nucleotide exchange factor GrpE [Oscillatoria salina IIICB1]
MIDDPKQQEKISEHPEDANNRNEETNNVSSANELGEQAFGVEQAEDSSNRTAQEDSEMPTEGDVAAQAQQEVIPDETAETAADTQEALAKEIEALKAELEQRTRQGESYKAQYLRIAADFDNFRKRTQKEKEELEQKVKCNTITELLPVVDNFERARTQIKPADEGEMGIHKSYQGVYKNLVDSLKRIGVSAMRPEGQEFDPNLHEAMLRQPTDEYPEGTVIEQLVRGYMLGDRVLRHAMVKVAAAPEPVVSSEEAAFDEESEVEASES